MNTYELESTLWTHFFLLMLIILLAPYIFHQLMRKFLKLEKKKWFSYNHVNKKHKIIDWWVRGCIIFYFLSSAIITIYTQERVWYLEPLFILFLYIMTTEITRAVMEYKYAKERRAYLLTVSQLLFLVLLVIIIWLIFLV